MWINICHWASSFYTNIRSSVIVNGKASSSFPIACSCRQGDSVSPLKECAEELSCKNKEFSDNEFKIIQFADDESFKLEGDKTFNVWPGSKRNCTEKFLPPSKYMMESTKTLNLEDLIHKQLNQYDRAEQEIYVY